MRGEHTRGVSVKDGKNLSCSWGRTGGEGGIRLSRKRNSLNCSLGRGSKRDEEQGSVSRDMLDSMVELASRGFEKMDSLATEALENRGARRGIERGKEGGLVKKKKTRSRIRTRAIRRKMRNALLTSVKKRNPPGSKDDEKERSKGGTKKRKLEVRALSRWGNNPINDYFHIGTTPEQDSSAQCRIGKRGFSHKTNN